MKMKRYFAVIAAVICSAMLAVNSFPVFAADASEGMLAYVETSKASLQAYDDGDYVLHAQYQKEYYSNKDITAAMLSRCLENTAETLAGAEDCAQSFATRYIDSMEITQEQKDAVLAGEKQFEITIIPRVAQNELFSLKEGQGISADDIRNAVSSWLYAVYLDDEPVAAGRITYEKDDAYFDYMRSVQQKYGIDIEPGYWLGNLGLSKFYAEDLSKKIEAAVQLGEVYSLNASDVFVQLNGDQVTFYENDEALYSDTPMSEKATEAYAKALYLCWMDRLDYNIIHAGERAPVLGSTGGYRKTAADFYPQAEFILYVRPWVIAGSVVLGLAVIGTIVLVIWKKRKTAK